MTEDRKAYLDTLDTQGTMKQYETLIRFVREDPKVFFWINEHWQEGEGR